jgi:transcription elongation factor
LEVLGPQEVQILSLAGHAAGLQTVGSLLFKDGFLYKTFPMKSIRTQNIQPSFDELEKFKRPGDDLQQIKAKTRIPA